MGPGTRQYHPGDILNVTTARTIPRDRRRATPAFPDTSRVRHLPDVGTPWVELFRATSDRDASVEYDVRFEARTGLWRCSCRATATCKHMRRCAHLRRVRFFSALWAGFPADALRDQYAHHRHLWETGIADADALAALDWLGRALARLEVA